MTDPVDLLYPPPPDPPDPARRAALLRLTTAQLVRPRSPWPGRVATAAAVAAAFVLGWAVKPAPPPRVERVEVPVEVRVEVPAPAGPSESAAADPPPTPERLELSAELAADPAEAARLYRLAGDAFLDPRRDYAEAARCYRLSLRSAPAADRRVGAADSWLLAQMKVSLKPEVSP